MIILGCYQSGFAESTKNCKFEFFGTRNKKKKKLEKHLKRKAKQLVFHAFGFCTYRFNQPWIISSMFLAIRQSKIICRVLLMTPDTQVPRKELVKVNVPYTPLTNHTLSGQRKSTFPKSHRQHIRLPSHAPARGVPFLNSHRGTR